MMRKSIFAPKKNAKFMKPLCFTLGMVTVMQLTACGNITGLMNAHDNFGCPAAGGVNCTTLSQTYEREAKNDDEQNRLTVIRRAIDTEIQKTQAFNREANGVAPAMESTEKKTTDIQAPTATIVETTTVRKIPVTVAPIETKRVVPEKRFNEARLATKPRHFQTSAGNLDRARSHERVVMLWVLPWVDDTGDLHEASRIWMRIEDAGWKIESVRTRAFETGSVGVLP